MTDSTTDVFISNQNINQNTKIEIQTDKNHTGRKKAILKVLTWYENLCKLKVEMLI